MEQFKGVCNTVYDTVFELAQKGLYGIIFLGVITLLFVVFSIYFNHIENTRKSAVVMRGIRSSYLIICFACIFGLTMLAKVIFCWEYDIVHALEISAIVNIANLLVYSVITTFIVFPITLLIKSIKSKTKTKKQIYKPKEKLKRAADNKNSETVTEYTRKWMTEKIKQNQKLTRAEILIGFKKDYIDGLIRELKDTENAPEVAHEAFNRYQNKWK